MNISDLFLPIITLVTGQITAMDLGKFRFERKKLIAILALELLISVVLSSSLLLIFGYNQYANWFFFTVDLPAIITMFYISKRRDMRDAFTILVAVFINYAISIPSMRICQVMDKGYSWYNLSRIIIFTVIIFSLHFFVRKRYILVQDEIEKGWGVFCILPFIGSIALAKKYLKFSREGDFNSIFSDCVIIVLIMATIFAVFNYVFNQLHEKYLVQEQRRILTMQNKAQKDQFEQLKEAAEKTNRRWHDMRHNTHELIGLLEAGNTEMALDYLKEQSGIGDVPKELYCLHPAVNSILCLWAERSRKSGIHIEILADVPANLDIEPMELSALFANAFENAYDGCLRLPENEPMFIKIEAHYNGKRLAIGFMNSCVEEISFIDDIPVSTKIGGGIGTRSMAYTIQRYRGAIYFEAKDKVFTSRFILNI